MSKNRPANSRPELNDFENASSMVEIEKTTTAEKSGTSLRPIRKNVTNAATTTNITEAISCWDITEMGMEKTARAVPVASSENFLSCKVKPVCDLLISSELTAANMAIPGSL